MWLKFKIGFVLTLLILTMGAGVLNFYVVVWAATRGLWDRATFGLVLMLIMKSSIDWLCDWGKKLEDERDALHDQEAVQF